jgi:hypothetical protein
MGDGDELKSRGVWLAIAEGYPGWPIDQAALILFLELAGTTNKEIYGRRWKFSD